MLKRCFTGIFYVKSNFCYNLELELIYFLVKIFCCLFKLLNWSFFQPNIANYILLSLGSLINSYATVFINLKTAKDLKFKIFN